MCLLYGRIKMVIFDYTRHLIRRALLFLLSGSLLFSFSLTPDLNSKALAQSNKPQQQEEYTGNVFNLYGRALGSVDTEGNITNLYGRLIGSVDSEGAIFNISKIAIGEVKPDGTIVNQAGTMLGCVNSDGSVYNVSGRKVGEVKIEGDIFLIGGAARLLFLK